MKPAKVIALTTFILVTKWGSLQAGYRWVYVDYETGSGTSRFRYDVLTQGPQLGFTLHF